MTIKKWTLHTKNAHHAKKTEYPQRSLTPEERDQLFKEMNMGWELLPPGCFPDGIWHLY